MTVWLQVDVQERNNKWQQLLAQARRDAAMSARGFDNASGAVGKHQLVVATHFSAAIAVFTLRSIDAANDDAMAGLEECGSPCVGSAEDAMATLMGSDFGAAVRCARNPRDGAALAPHLAVAKECYANGNEVDAFAIWRACMHREVGHVRQRCGTDVVGLLRERGHMLRMVRPRRAASSPPAWPPACTLRAVSCGSSTCTLRIWHAVLSWHAVGSTHL